jgi:virulence-associated protein VagC
MTDRARVFWSGRSQAVRLPKAFRLSVGEVAIRREGEALVLQPLELRRDAKGWPQAFWELAGAAPEFSTGARPARHERGDVLRRRR